MPVNPDVGEKQGDFMRRCVPEMVKSGHEQAQAVAVCLNIYTRQEKKAIVLELLEKSMAILKYQLGVRKNDPVKRHEVFNGIPIHIEWLDGEVRQYSGSKMKNKLNGFSYGYVPLTETADGEEVDVYLRSNPNQEAPAFMLTQLKGSDEKGIKGTFDEHKWFLGFDNADEVERTYCDFMPRKMFGGCAEVSMEEFKNNHLKVFRQAKAAAQ